MGAYEQLLLYSRKYRSIRQTLAEQLCAGLTVIQKQLRYGMDFTKAEKAGWHFFGNHRRKRSCDYNCDLTLSTAHSDETAVKRTPPAELLSKVCPCQADRRKKQSIRSSVPALLCGRAGIPYAYTA